MSEFITVAKVGDIPEGEGRAFEYEDQMVAVFNDGGQYRAIDDMCPHMGASLAAGHLENSVVTCPWHAWSFDTRDGTWCENRRLSVDVYQVRVVGDEIQIAAAEAEPAVENQARDSSAESTAASNSDSQQDDATQPDPGGQSSSVEGEHD